MTQPAKREGELFQTGNLSRPESAPPDNVRYLEFVDSRPVPRAGFISIGDLIESLRNEPGFDEEMAEARKQLSDHLYAEDAVSFSALRLRSGLSQRELAKRLNTSQSHIARIELGQLDPGTDTIDRIAAAIGVEPGEAFNAILHQRKTRGAK
ncbi:MAG: helix-turn-helix transcriptional regulator [Azoarcus sp.]|jgi:DNA-binding transcriptional regulator YiaG|nr:helix-turn-helix transcriptional regulator [Azoarcus sp.]